MKLKYYQNLIPAIDGMQKVASISCSPQGDKVAVCTADRVIHMFDDQGQLKDKFGLKAGDPTQKSFVCRGIEFSPCNTKIAVAQSDSIVFVYKIGTEWKEKKTICNKFQTSSSVSCMTWPRKANSNIFFGLAEGKIKVGILKVNKSQTCYGGDSYCISIASSKDGESIVSGHVDGKIYTFNIQNQSYQQVVEHHSIPYALGIGENIVAAGNDGKVSFYDSFGNLLQRFDYTNDPKVKEFTNATFNPSGDTVVLGNFNRFYIYNYQTKRGQWEEIGMKTIENYYTVTSLGWKSDGSKLITGSLCGAVDVYNASLQTIIYKGKFELNYVSPSQIVVKTLLTGSKAICRSNYSYEISKVNIHQDQFIVANTHQTLILVDLKQNKQSEIKWKGYGNEKFDFSNPNVCMIYNAGELTLMEYGNDEILGTCRTEHMKKNLISARLAYSQQSSQKVIAYLLDQQTILIQDLIQSTTVGQINHDSKIEFLELNASANKLLFRDKVKQLFLYDIKLQKKDTLLSYCRFSQWVPQSEVVVAQNRNNLCVWYSIENPDKVTIYNIKGGDIEYIERTETKTEVIVNDASNSVSYTLDEPLIKFGFAVQQGDLEQAANILDPLDINQETISNWKTLAKLALEQQKLFVAEHCYASLGDVPKARFIRKINKMVVKYEKENPEQNGMQFYKVQAQLALLNKQFQLCEQILIDHNEVEEAMEMYQLLHKWDESIKIAEKMNHPDVNELTTNYFVWLIESNQEDKAGELKENSGDYNLAINYYLKAGLPGRAANVVFNYNHSFPQEILEQIAQALYSQGMYEKAGEFYEQMGVNQKSIDCYVKAFAFKSAVDIARRSDHKQVGQLEMRWGDYLVQQKQTEQAIPHYIEAGNMQKAVESCISSRQWNKTIQLLSNQSPEFSRPYYKQIAKHYADVKQYDFGEKYYLKANLAIEAFEMYAQASKWEQALKVAKDNLNEGEIVQMYVQQATKFETNKMYKEAEKLYLTVDQEELAIKMYKKAQLYDHMVRLVGRFRPNVLKDTHYNIGKRYEKDQNFKQAEHHYIESGYWNSAVDMYKSRGNWEEAIRCCKLYGTDKETSELAKQWADTLGPIKGPDTLLKHKLIDSYIDYQCDKKEFDDAFQMAKQLAKHKYPDVCLKNAFYLEDEKRFKEAEEMFIKAGKYEEAINMYEHLGYFNEAIQVAKSMGGQKVPVILVNQAKMFIERREYQRAEHCFIQAKKPDLAVKMYLENDNCQEALRVAQNGPKHLIPEIERRMNQLGSRPQQQGGDPIQFAKQLEQSGKYQQAINYYLEINKDQHDQNICINAWKQAANLAIKFDKQRAPDIARLVCKRLKEIGNFELAAQLYISLGMYNEAIQTYVQGKMFDQALDCTKKYLSNLPNFQQTVAYIEEERQKGFEQGGDIDSLITSNPLKAVEALIQTQNWAKALEVTFSKLSGDIQTKTLYKYANTTMKNGQFGATIAAYAKYGMSPVREYYPLYIQLCKEIFVEADAKELLSLKTALFGLSKLLQGTQDNNTPQGKELLFYTLVAHFLDLNNQYEKKNMSKLKSLLSLACLKYCNLIRLDKLYQEAGMAQRKQNNDSTAFILLNRFLDIYEVIEDPENNNLVDDQNFQITDIPSPYDVPLPDKNIISEQQFSEIREWLLQISMKTNQDQHKFQTFACENCNSQIHVANQSCPVCKHQYQPCIITGFPILKGQSVNCKSCGKPGIKQYWQEYLQNFASCPWCLNPPN